jgi:hypothetical protein
MGWTAKESQSESQQGLGGGLALEPFCNTGEQRKVSARQEWNPSHPVGVVLTKYSKNQVQSSLVRNWKDVQDVKTFYTLI